MWKPTTLENFFDRGHVSLLKNYVTSWLSKAPVTNAVLLYGAPGVGKSLLPSLLATEFNLDLYVTDASDERSKLDIVKLSQTMLSQSVKGTLKLLFVDECDNLTASAYRKLHTLIEMQLQPIILACNDLYSVPWYLRENIWVVEFPYPDTKELAQFLAWVEQKTGKHVTEKVRRLFLGNAVTFRDIVMMLSLLWSAGVVLAQKSVDFDTYGEIRQLSLNPEYRPTLRPDELLTWLYDNSTNLKLLDGVNELLGHSPVSDNSLLTTDKTYDIWSYCVQALSYARFEGLDYPRTIKLMKKRKDETEARKEKVVRSASSVKENDVIVQLRGVQTYW
jgi:hypothetical protein